MICCAYPNKRIFFPVSNTPYYCVDLVCCPLGVTARRFTTSESRWRSCSTPVTSWVEPTVRPELPD